MYWYMYATQRICDLSRSRLQHRGLRGLTSWSGRLLLAYGIRQFSHCAYRKSYFLACTGSASREFSDLINHFETKISRMGEKDQLSHANIKCFHLILTFHFSRLIFIILWANSADEKLTIFFLLFPENRLWLFMQIVSQGGKLHEMTKSPSW